MNSPNKIALKKILIIKIEIIANIFIYHSICCSSFSSESV